MKDKVKYGRGMSKPYVYQYDWYNELRRASTDLLRTTRCQQMSIERTCAMHKQYVSKLIKEKRITVDPEAHVITFVDPGVSIECLSLLPLVPGLIDKSATYELHVLDTSVYRIQYVKSQHGELAGSWDSFMQLYIGYMVALEDGTNPIRGISYTVPIC